MTHPQVSIVSPAAAAAGIADRCPLLASTAFACALTALARRFDVLHRAADLDEAIAHARAAVAGLAPDDPSRRDWLSNLGVSLERRQGRPGDLDEAIEIGRAVLAATPADEPIRAGFPLELLERGRGRLWTQLLDVRTTTDALAAADPRLAAALEKARIAPDTPSLRSGAVGIRP